MTDHVMTRAAIRPRADAPTAFLHWALVATLAVSLLTGLRIAADALDSTWAHALDSLLPQGSVTRWHVAAAYGLTAIALAYVVFLLRARLFGRIALDGARLRAFAAPDRRNRWQVFNVAVYWVSFLLIALGAVTGTLLYLETALVPHDLLAAIHRAVAWTVLIYVAAHILSQFMLGGVRQLLKILTPRLVYGAAAAVGIATAAVAGAAIYGIDAASLQVLHAARIATPPEIDGLDFDGAWVAATPIQIHTVRGANFPGGEVTVRVRALHDDSNAYFLFEWPDTSRSQKHLPLIKTIEGWKVLEHRYGMQDENDYYEDKFGVMLARTAELAGAGSSHLGGQPIGGKPGSPNHRGLHFTADGSIVDVWHWKSVRTGPLGQLDDNYFGPPMEPDKDPKKRYTGGYTQDPKTAGGFIQNWEKRDHGLVQPLHLPADAEQVVRLTTANLDPKVGDDGQWWMPLAATVPYSPEIDTFPVGTVIPSAVIEKPFEGDRGDVHGVGVWRDGWWHLEVSRKLDTGSQFDVPIASGTYLWVVAFDHAQTRHTQHIHPAKLELE